MEMGVKRGSYLIYQKKKRGKLVTTDKDYKVTHCGIPFL